jgi:hypothetical protein
MASGYEKHACGVDPNTGWGKPRPVASALLTGAAVALAVIHWGAKLWWLWAMIAACLR